MNKAEVLKLVEEGFALDQEIKAKGERLDAIKELIATHANGEVLEIAAEGCKATVNYSARLASRVDPELLPKAKKAAGEFFEKLFCYAPIDQFRSVAKALLGEKGVELAGLLSGVPSPRVSFKKA